MPIRYARSWRKKISAMVADGRHSTGLIATPWKTLAASRDEKLGDQAAHRQVPMKTMALTRYTGRFPNRMAVGEAITEPIPKPIMYRPVVSETVSTETS